MKVNNNFKVNASKYYSLPRENISQQALKLVIYYTPVKIIIEIYISNKKFNANPDEFLRILIFSIITIVYISIVP